MLTCKEKKLLGKTWEFLEGWMLIKGKMSVRLGEYWRITVEMLPCGIPVHHAQLRCLEITTSIRRKPRSGSCYFLAANLGASSRGEHLRSRLMYSVYLIQQHSSGTELKSTFIEDFYSRWQFCPLWPFPCRGLLVSPWSKTKSQVNLALISLWPFLKALNLQLTCLKLVCLPF